MSYYSPPNNNIKNALILNEWKSCFLDSNFLLLHDEPFFFLRNIRGASSLNVTNFMVFYFYVFCSFMKKPRNSLPMTLIDFSSNSLVGYFICQFWFGVERRIEYMASNGISFWNVETVSSVLGLGIDSNLYASSRSWESATAIVLWAHLFAQQHQ